MEANYIACPQAYTFEDRAITTFKKSKCKIQRINYKRINPCIGWGKIPLNVYDFLSYFPTRKAKKLKKNNKIAK
jgi:hypothetical protein